MSITPLPTPPSRADSEAVFVSRANAFLSALPAFADEANAVAADLDAAVASADADATAAAASAAAAFSASQAAGYKGVWSTLTGALALPASTFHNGGFWALITPVANVALAEPGVSAAWVQVGADVTEQVTDETLLFSFFFAS